MVELDGSLVGEGRDRGVDVHDLADHPGLEHRHQMPERRAVGGLVGHHQGAPLGLGDGVKFLGLSQMQHERGLAEHILSGFEGRLGIFEMSVVR